MLIIFTWSIYNKKCSSMKVDKNVKAFLSLSSLLIDPHNPEEIVFSLNVYIRKLHCCKELEPIKDLMGYLVGDILI